MEWAKAWQLGSFHKMQPEPASPIETHPPRVVSVHSLVEFVLQSGDITPGGFQRRDRAQLGTQGHRQVQRSRPEGYEAEVEISYRVENADFPLEVRGRMDEIGRASCRERV